MLRDAATITILSKIVGSPASFVLFACLSVLLMPSMAGADNWFSDRFDGATIDPTHWTYGGDGISVSDGLLHLVRDGTDDFVQTVSTYSGDFNINLDVRLNSIGWIDMFHGIKVADSAGNGVSFGFSEYSSLYLAQLAGGGAGFGYGGSNNLGSWQHWTLQKRGGTMTVLVGGQQTFQGSVPDNVSVSLPGYYQNGGSPTGFTSSDIDYFSIAPLVLPGDANGDAKVDVNDLTIVLTSYGLSGMTWVQGDFNGDNRVDVNDLTIVLTNYGQGAGSSLGGIAAVPEPGALALLAAGLLGLCACVWRKAKQLQRP
jgi:hypothetical protein